MIEALESRELLSGTTTTSTTIEGYTPAEIRQAYGFNSVTFANSSVAANGAGQTIAIVDAYNDPNITNDIQVFDSEFDLSSLNLTIVNQTGGTKLPSTDAGWATEISLDVEWAHAIAPGANILLVEANSDSLSDLMTAVDYARNAAGVSVVSMSWGGSEFFSWNGGEDSSETDYDSYFTTPSGHQGVTFVAAAGDSGAAEGVDWPSTSPNVISVGGTSLTLDSNGNYVSESSWSGTSGGYSVIEPEPSYQDSVQSTGYRSTPDVSYDADPNTGFAVYDSLAYEGSSGWQEYGGTSAGSPQWAALIAIADQGRTLAGEDTLDGPTQTLPLLYGVYTDSTDYSSVFNDVVDNTSSHNPFHWRWGGYSHGNSATTGYDTATGLGSPKAQGVVNLLVGTSSTTTSGSGGSTSSGSGSTSSGSGSTSSGSGSTSGSGSSGSSGSTTSTLAASPFSITFAKYPDATVIAGDSDTVRVSIDNTSSTAYGAPLTINVYLSTDATVSSDDTLIGTLTISRFKLASGKSTSEKISLSYPSDLSSGNFYVIASAAVTTSNTADATVATTVAVSAQSVDLAATFAASQALAVTPGKTRAVAITITNLGNVTAVGTFSLDIYAASGSTLASASQALGGITGRSIKLRAGKSMTIYVRITAPDTAAGTYNLLASLTPALQLADANSANNIATIGTRSAT